MKNFEWINAAQRKPKVGEDYPVLVWVYDDGVGIGYCWKELCYWNGIYFIPDKLSENIIEPLGADDGLVVTAWCYVPKAQNRLLPHGL